MSLELKDFNNWLQHSHQYSGGHKGYHEDKLYLSATDFCKSPQEIRLLLAHKDELPSLTVKDTFRANVGTVLHKSFEDYFSEYADAVVEKRNTVELELCGLKVVLTGQADMIYKGQLYDLKTRSTYSDGKDHHFGIQGSIYKNLLFPEVTEPDLILVNLWHNWVEKEGNPESPITLETVELMSQEETLQFLSKWIEGFLSPESTCSDEDRWLSPTTYALMKPGASRAFRVFNTYQEASAALSKHKGYQVVERIGEPKKCISYCPVAAFCPQLNLGASNDERGYDPIKL